MKTICNSFLIVCTIYSCAQPKLYQQRINDIPTSSPNFNADIRFIGQNLPKNPYFEITDIYLEEKGDLTKSQVKKKLEHEAIKEGLDGILNVESWKASKEVSTLLTILIDILEDDGDPTTVTAYKTIMTGKGFIYLESVDDINSRPEYEYFYELDPISDFPEPLFKIEFKLTGQEYMVYPESAWALDIYKNYFQFYSDYHLLTQREGWVYFSEDLKIKKRILKKNNGYTSKICVPEYDLKDRIRRLKILHRRSDIDKNEYVNYTYNDSGMVTKRIVEVYDGTTIFEEYQYNQNRLQGRTIVINRPGEEKINLQTSIHFYDQDYLKDYYFNEIANERLK